jgi:MFS transporter, BCD family, chlorophyll transporter
MHTPVAAAGNHTLTWFGIVRLGLVQTALGSIVVLATSTLNRVMIVELALPAIVPGALIALHYAVQALRPRWGYGSDVGGKLTPWIIGGMGVLAAGGVAAAAATAWMATSAAAGVALAVLAYLMIGIGVGAAGTSLLVLLAKSVDPRRRAPAATIVWIMMIAGFAITATVAGHYLDPFSSTRLIAVMSIVSLAAFVLACIAIWGVERGVIPVMAAAPSGAGPEEKPPFREAIAMVWAEPMARRFTIFIFISMLAYSAQEFILEPFAGAVFGMTPGHSTKLTGLQHGGVLVGMILVAVVGSMGEGLRSNSARFWTSGGCFASALSLLLIVAAGAMGHATFLRTAIFILGVSNGAFAAAAIGSMMAMAGQGRSSCEGVRMGIWGAAQGIAFGFGGLFGTIAVDLSRIFIGAPVPAYSAVFVAEALLFLVSAILAINISGRFARDAEQAAEFASARAG